MIEVKNLVKKYGSFTAVDDITFKVNKGEILGFLGPNAAGKTTTMRVITGFMPPSEGNVIVGGFNVTEKPLEVKRLIGYLPENPPLYVDMKVVEYLKFVAALKGVEKADINHDVSEVCEKVAITNVIDKVIKTLSKGYRQRVGLAQALIHNPEVLILDEPTIGLDPIQIREVRELIKSLGGDHTVILSTHILPEVSMTCDRVIIIDKGKLIAQDTPSGLTQSLKGAEKLTIIVEGPEPEVYGAISSTTGVKQILEKSQSNGAISLTIECDFQFHVRKNISQMVSEKGWDLIEMKVEESTLEDVFLQLMSSDEVVEVEEVVEQ